MKKVKNRIKYLNQDQIERIHEATCQLLAKTGIHLMHKTAKEKLIEAGASEDGERILIPQDMIENALKKTPSKFTLYNQNGKNPKELKVGNVLFGTGSDSLYVIDYKTNKVRETKLSDLIDLIRVADELPEYDFIMSMGLPKEVPGEELYGTVFLKMVLHSNKPIIATSTSLSALKQAFKVAQIVTGSQEAFKEKPFFISYLEPESPLKFTESFVNRLWFSGEKGIPTMSTSAALMGGLAPATFEGAVVQGTAESLAGLVLLQTMYPGSKFVFGANVGALDLRTSLDAYGAPESNRANAVFADLGNFYNLPTWGTAGCSDAHRIDGQAGEEAFQSILLSLQSGTTIAHDVGYLAYGSLYDARFLVSANEMISRAKWTWKNFNTDKNAFAIDVISDALCTSIKQEGGTSFINHPHTVKNCRKEIFTPPKFIERGRISSSKQGRPLLDKLTEEVERILTTTTQQKKSKKKQKQLQKIKF